MICYARGHANPRDAQRGSTIPFVLSDPRSEARDGLTLNLSRMDMTDFKRNPVALHQHGRDPHRGFLPIGRWANVRVNSDGQLVGDLEFDPDDPFAMDLHRRVQQGFMSACSISWRDTASGHELLEASLVSVPADPGALVAGRTVWTVGQERDRIPGRIVYERGNGALIRCTTTKDGARICTPQNKKNALHPADRVAERQHAAMTKALLDEVELWLLVTRSRPFRSRFLPRVESTYKRLREMEQRINDDFASGKASLTETAELHAGLQDAIAAYAHKIPGLNEQVRTFVLTGQMRSTVRNSEGMMA